MDEWTRTGGVHRNTGSGCVVVLMLMESRLTLVGKQYSPDVGNQ